MRDTYRERRHPWRLWREASKDAGAPGNLLPTLTLTVELQAIAGLWYNSAYMPSELELFTSTMQRRQLATPLLLLLASHRPLTFVAGQLLYALAQMSLLLGWENANQWAALLSAPNANQLLARLLETEQQKP